MYKWCAVLSAAAVLLHPVVAVKLSNADTSLTFVFQNNLNASDDGNHRGAILLDSMSATAGTKACSQLGEPLLLQSTIKKHESDYAHALSYLEYAGLADQNQEFHINNGVLTVHEKTETLQISQHTYSNRKLPVLCAQSSNQNNASNAKATTSNEISIKSAGNTYVGFRNQKSFRFVGIPYANPTERFAYSTVYSKKGKTITATAYGPDCAQAYDDSSKENCLFMNIQTPYIPKAGSKANLRPVLMSIYGGGFTGGNSGPFSGLDTGNLASREDIVGVQFNYRLSTLGFLAIPGTKIKGNFGIGDQVTALKWVRENIAQFGGDPEKITIIGESAGAGSVRALLGSPPVIDEGLIEGAVAQSNLGGGVDLGLDSDYGTTYSSYLTIAASYKLAGQQIFHGVGCNQSSLSAQIACLKTVPWQKIQNLATVARYVVQDGTFVNTEQLDVTNTNGSTAHVPVIFGTTANDGASFSTFPPANISTEAEGIEASLGITAEYANLIINSGLFPYYNTGNLSLDSFNVSQRVATDKTFRCIDEATVYAGAKTGAFKSAYYYTIERTYAGYDPNNLGLSGLSSGPVEPGYPYGDPNLPYFRLHGSDLGFTYGNQNPLRDADDLKAAQLISGYFAQFAKAGDPNPDVEYLKVRGYTNVSFSISLVRWSVLQMLTVV
jgi:carboxylesterase type B